MRQFITITACCLLMTVTSQAQDAWDLRKIVDYAMANNITVKLAGVQAEDAGLLFRQSKLSLYPNATLTPNLGFNSGRNQDPTSFNLITQSYLSAGMQLQTSADIFNFYSKRNNILANQWEYEAAKANTDKIRNDIALTAANSYLQVLLTREQENIALVQLRQTQAQLANTKKQVNAGSLPELNAAELEAQEARDSANYVSAKGNVTQAILVLKSNLNLDAGAPFEVAIPPVEKIPVEKIADLQPEAVFALAMQNLPQQKFNEFKIKAAKKFTEAARGAMYPTFGVYGSLSSNYINSSTPVYTPTGTFSATPLSPQIEVNGTVYKVTSPDYTISSQRTPFFNQFSNNFRQSVGLSINIPIFNGAQLRTNWLRNKLGIRRTELQQESDALQIKQDIYQAYNAAVVALEKFNASRKSVEASQRTLDFAQKRYDVGMLGTFELITNQNNLFRARLEYVLNQFDYMFKMKVLEFYRGQGLKL